MAAPTFVGIVSSGWVTGAGTPSVNIGPLGILAGDLIVACMAGRGDSVATAPTGFALAQPGTTPATSAGNLSSYVWFKTATGSETTINPTGLPGDLRSLMVAVYRGLAGPHMAAAANKSVAELSAGPPNPSITPPAGRPAAIVAWDAHDPNYFPTPPAGYTSRQIDDGGSTPRTLSKLSDQLVALTAGSYAGSYTGAGGETCWALQNVAFMTGVGGSFPGEPGGAVW